MNTRFLFTRIILSAILILLLGVGIGFAQDSGNPEGVSALQGLAGTAFTYQGRLKDGGSPANGVYDLQFTLYADSGGASLVAGPITIEDLSLTDGYFTVQLDFGVGAFNGQERYLLVGVRPGASVDPFTSLSPLQNLTPAPLALALPGLWTQQNATSPNLIGGYSSNWVTPGIYGATISGGGVSGYPNSVTDHYGTVGGGVSNLAGNGDATLDNAVYATVGGGESNHASGDHATIGGGIGNRASAYTATVGGGDGNRASNNMATVSGGQDNHASGDHATVGGGAYNTASGDYATVGGGSGNLANYFAATVGGGDGNRASNNMATVSGGQDNHAIGDHATISGGQNNQASGGHATVGGGLSNQASADATTVGGGWGNQASVFSATVGGGRDNQASAKYATVPGGNLNTAAGFSSFAAGYRAKANHQGAFVWGDSTDDDISSAAADQFLVRASGGVTLTFGTGALRLLPNAESPNIIGGYSGNSVTSGVYGATIAGGGSGTYPNEVTDYYGTVGGGNRNRAGNADATLDNADYATVGGGGDNQASWYCATVSGGGSNRASNQFATIGGGQGNQASGLIATIGGGQDNQASESFATVAGGYDNHASGLYATVPGGYGANATHCGELAYASGSFVSQPGSAQTSQYVMRITTNNAIPTPLSLDGDISPRRLTIAAGRTLTFDALVVARSDTGLSAGYRMTGVIANVGGATSIIGADVIVFGYSPGAASWNAFLGANDTDDALDILVNGAAGVNVRWVAFVRTVEVQW